MNILVIFTGGTIGSAVSDGWISPSDDMKYLLLRKYSEKTGDLIQFDTLNPYTVLSENLSAEHLNKLIKCVRYNIDGCDGVIVTHGTDTLQYSAAAVSYAMGTDCAPVLFVSSNYPLEDERANGLDNFIAAVEFIKAKAGRGVYVSYKNGNQPVQIHYATRLLSHNECLDEVYSADHQPYAVFDGKILLNDGFNPPDTVAAVEEPYFCDCSSVLTVVAMPGDSFSYDLSSVKAVILRPYHSGTLNTASVPFVSFCRRAADLDIPVFLVNAPEGITYDSSKVYDKLGIIALEGSVFPAVYVKIWLAVSQNKDICGFVCNN